MAGRYIFLILLLNFNLALSLEVQNAVDIYACSSNLVCVPINTFKTGKMDCYDEYLPIQVTTNVTKVYYLKQYAYENVVFTEQKKLSFCQRMKRYF
jgi:hypothetical protein